MRTVWRPPARRARASSSGRRIHSSRRARHSTRRSMLRHMIAGSDLSLDEAVALVVDIAASMEPLRRRGTRRYGEHPDDEGPTRASERQVGARLGRIHHLRGAAVPVHRRATLPVADVGPTGTTGCWSRSCPSRDTPRNSSRSPGWSGSTAPIRNPIRTPGATGRRAEPLPSAGRHRSRRNSSPSGAPARSAGARRRD